MPPLLPVHRVAGGISEVNVLSCGHYCHLQLKRLMFLYVDKERHKQKHKWSLDAMAMAQSE